MVQSLITLNLQPMLFCTHAHIAKSKSNQYVLIGNILFLLFFFRKCHSKVFQSNWVLGRKFVHQCQTSTRFLPKQQEIRKLQSMMNLCITFRKSAKVLQRLTTSTGFQGTTMAMAVLHSACNNLVSNTPHLCLMIQPYLTLFSKITTHRCNINCFFTRSFTYKQVLRVY